MAKFCGKIGYSVQTEVRPGVWDDTITEKTYYGDVMRNIRKLESSGNANDDINISNEISIVADPFAESNFHAIRYVDFMGTKWKVTSIEVQRPRLRLTLGGIWNG